MSFYQDYFLPVWIFPYTHQGVPLRLCSFYSFDFEYQPQNKDRLLISLLDSANKDFDEEYSESIAYGYEYKNGKWKIKDYETFEWYEKYDEILEGKIENLYKKKN